MEQFVSETIANPSNSNCSTTIQPGHHHSIPATHQLASGLRNFWYAVGFSSQIKASTIQPFELFDQPWVLFRDRNGKIACIKDECAHRACPLSLGEVVDGRLRCGYHGWIYRPDGICEDMPSCHQTRASVDHLSAVDLEGFIWVWPGEQEPAPIPTSTYAIPPGFSLQAEISMDLPVEHGLLMENLLDLAHAPFTHTGTFAKGWPIPDSVKFLTHAKTPLAGHWDPYPIQMSFAPPCYVISTIGLRGRECGKNLHQIHCCLPAGEGRTRLLYRLCLDFWHWAKRIPGKDKLWQHLAHSVINEDLRLIIGQQKRMLAGADIWKTPVAYDKLGVRYRRWRNQIEKNSGK